MYNKKIRNLVFAPLLYTIHLFGQDYTVASGSAKSTVKGSHHIIETSPNAVLHWKDFSVAAKEHLHFAQNNAASSVLNRVTGDQLSQILGSMTSNGKVYLFNPNGIFIGKDACIHTAGFLASTANFSNDDFFKGQQLFLEAFPDSAIVNQGKISCSEGDIFLIAKQVINEGECSGSYIGAGPAFKIIIQPSRDQRLFIQPDLGEILNTGTLQALAIELRSASAYEKAIRTEGSISASDIVLCAENGGMSVDGFISAPQGNVQILGKEIFVGSTTHIDVSADIGGQIYVGGGQGGKDSALFNAATVKVEQGALISADGYVSDAGKVIIWSDDSTEMYGHITAHGAGSGGFVEVSGKRSLNIDDIPDVRSDSGNNGTLLLDPGSVTIINGVNTPPTVNGTFTDGYINNFLNTTGNLIISTASDSILGSETLTVAGTASINWSTTNNLTLIGNLNLVVASGATINASGSGSLNLQGNPLGTFTGTVNGIDITGATLAATSGSITLTGISGTIDTNVGIRAQGTATITTTSGSIALYGIGAGTVGASNNVGVELSGTIISNTGSILISGTSTTSGTGAGNTGILSQGVIQTQSSGTITLLGQSGASSGVSNLGITIGGSITSVAGTITITGSTAGAGNGSNGIQTANCVIATNTGPIFLNGSCTSTGNSGVNASVSSIINSNSGSITLVGTANGLQSLGIRLSQSDIFTTSTGNIYFTGIGGIVSNSIGIANITGTVATVNGNITFTGSSNGTGNVNSGISNSGPVQSTGSGSIFFTGQGGNATGSANHGVLISGTTGTVSTTTGSITITGFTPATGSFSDGVHLQTGGSVFATGAGLISINGLSGLGGTSTGINLPNASASFITSQGGTILLAGTSRGLAAQNVGIFVGSNTAVTTIDPGNISFIGVGGSGTDACQGIFVNGTVRTGSGSIIFIGQGGSATGTANHGVLISGTTGGGTVTTTAGSITITGFTSATGSFSDGVNLQNGGRVFSIGAGLISINGLSGLGGTSMGINLANSSGSFISSLGGTFSLAGTSRGLAAQNVGIFVGSNTAVTTIDPGNISFIGVGGSGTDASQGIFINGTVSANTKSISFTGSAFATGTNNQGIAISSGLVQTSSSGNITLTGQGGSGTGTANHGILITGATGTVSTSSGTITITGFTAATGNLASGVQLETSGKVTANGAASININGLSGFGNTANGVELNSSLPSITSGGGTISIIGTSRGTSTIAIGILLLTGSKVTTTSLGNINLTGFGGGGTATCTGIFVNGSVTTVSGNITLVGTSHGSANLNTGITYSSPGFISSTVGNGLITLTGAGGPASGTANHGVLISRPITTVSGTINITGVASATGNLSDGIQLSSAGTITSSGSAPIALNGIGGAGGTCNGILLTGAGTGIFSTSSGNIALTGSSHGSSLGIGVDITTGAQVNSSGTGSVSIIGVGSSGTTLNDGISISALVTSTSGNISLTGTSNGAGNTNRGIAVTAGGSVTSTSGAITAQGTGGATAPNSWGILIDTARVASATGAISLTGISSGATEEGILIDNSSLVQTNNASLVSLTTLSDMIIQNGSNVNLLGSTPLSLNSSRDLSVLGGAGLPAYISIENGNGTLVVGRDLNVVSGTGAGSEAQIGNHGGLVASASGGLTFTSIGRNVNVTATDPGAFALIGHGTPATAQTLSGNILFTSVANDMTLTGAPAGAGSFGFAQIGHVNATAGGSTLSGAITATCGNNINVLGGGAASAYAQIGHGGQAGAATFGAGTLSLFAGVNCTITSSTGDAIVTNQAGDLTVVVDNLNSTPPAIGSGAFSFSSTLTSTGNLKIYTAIRSQNNVPSGTVINGAVYTPGTLFVDTTTEEWGTYYPGGTYTPGSAFKLYYKDGTNSPTPPPAPTPPFIPSGLPIANLGSLADSITDFSMNLQWLKCMNFSRYSESGYLECRSMPLLISSMEN